MSTTGKHTNADNSSSNLEMAACSYTSENLLDIYIYIWAHVSTLKILQNSSQDQTGDNPLQWKVSISLEWISITYVYHLHISSTIVNIIIIISHTHYDCCCCRRECDYRLRWNLRATVNLNWQRGRNNNTRMSLLPNRRRERTSNVPANWRPNRRCTPPQIIKRGFEENCMKGWHYRTVEASAMRYNVPR